jgi:hypothetical protein
MVNDRKLFLFLMFLIALPVGLAFFGNDRFRYPCQNPENWEKDICQKPQCDVTRTCPEHVFKGQRDPRLGPDNAPTPSLQFSAPAQACAPATQGANCAK